MRRLTAILIPLTLACISGSAADFRITSPDAALERYLSQAEQGASANAAAENVEIRAAIPKLSKHGYFRAIRHRDSRGMPEYEVLQVEGDATVKQQVIARYLVAESRTGATTSSTLAISQANYRFVYAGNITTAGKLVYVFDITPRKKRSGLMQGQLWIDAATGLAIHQSGRLVKNPSPFIRRVDVTRDTELRDDGLAVRVTHLDIDTRLVGHATLAIVERPVDSMSVQSASLIANREDAGEREP